MNKHEHHNAKSDISRNARYHKPVRMTLKVFGIIIGVVVIFLLGYAIGNKNLVFEENYKPKIVNLEFGKPRDVDFSVFWETYNKISQKYVGDFSSQDLLNGAVDGMVDALGDPYTSFMDEEENRLLKQDLSGELEGIGAEIARRDDKVIIVSPLDDSPAERAGLKAKDVIVKINDEDTEKMDVDQAVSKIRGKAGTEVKLLINREGFREAREFVIKREKIVVKSVNWEMRDRIAYIEITRFGDDTTELMKSAASEIKAQNPKSIILDLRNNPGGYLDTSIDVASLFMNRGVVVKEQYKEGRIEELKTTLEGELKDYSISVLINEGSASASEIVAGALRDARGAKIIGEKSFGKGSVQELVELKGKNTLRVTIAHWLTPSGKIIDKEGISPDIEVKMDSTDYDNDRDPQLDKALEEANK